MRNSTSLQNNLGIFLSGIQKKFTSRPAAPKDEAVKGTLTKSKFKSLSPFKGKVLGRKSVLMRSEYKLNKVEVYPNPDNKVLFSPEFKPIEKSPRPRIEKNSENCKNNEKSSEILKNDEKAEKTGKKIKDPEREKAKLTKIVLALVLEKVKNKEIVSFQQFSEFFTDVLKEEHQAGALKGMIKGEINKADLIEKLGQKLGVRIINKKNPKEGENTEIKEKQHPVEENNLASKEKGLSEEKGQNKAKDSQNILKKIKNIKHEQVRASTVGNKSKSNRLKYSANSKFNENVEESLGNLKDLQENIRESKGRKPGSSVNEARTSSEYYLVSEKDKEPKVVVDDNPAGDEFVNQRSKTEEFLRHKKENKEKNLPNIKLLPRLRRTLLTNNAQSSLTEQELTSRLLESTMKNSDLLINLLENPQNPPKPSDSVLKSSEGLKRPAKNSNFPLKSSGRSYLSRSSSSHTFTNSKPNPAYILENSGKSSRISPWVNSSLSRSDLIKSNKSSSQQSSVITGKAAKFSVSNQFKAVQSKTAQKLQKVYEKQLKELWTQINLEKSPQNSVNNPNLQQKSHQGNSYLNNLMTKSKKINKNVKNSQSQLNGVKVDNADAEKNSENSKFFQGSEAKFLSTPDLLIPSRSTETLNIPYSNSLQTLRNSQRLHYKPGKNTRTSYMKKVRRSQTTLIHLNQPDKSFEIPSCAQFIYNCAEHLVDVFRSEDDGGKGDLWYTIKNFLLNSVGTPPRSPDVKTMLKNLFINKEIKPENFQFFWPTPNKQTRTFERRLSAFIFKDNELDEENRIRLIEKQEFLNSLHSRSKSNEKYEFRAFDIDYNPYTVTEEPEDWQKLQKKRKFAIKIQDLIEKRMKKKKSYHERCKKT